MSSQPFIQVVDENDRPIKGEAIELVYEQSLIHRVVYVGIFNNKHELLLQKRGDAMHTDPGKWDMSVGGHVDLEESYEQAAIREMKEEIGISDVPLKEVFYSFANTPINGTVQRRFVKTYIGSMNDDIKIIIDNNEVSQTKWLSIAAINQLEKLHPEQVATGLSYVMSTVTF